MPVDTRNKRASVLGFALAALVVLPTADTVIDQGDRQQTAFSYRGIAVLPLSQLDICDTAVVSLQPDRAVSSLQPDRTVSSICP